MMQPSTLMLRRILAFDAASGAAMAITHFGASEKMSSWLGLPASWLTVSGLILLGAVSLAASLALQASPSRHGVRLLAAGNFVWVAASIWVVSGAGLTLTPFGMTWVLLQAIVVFFLAELEWLGSHPNQHGAAGAYAS